MNKRNNNNNTNNHRYRNSLSTLDFTSYKSSKAQKTFLENSLGSGLPSILIERYRIEFITSYIGAVK